MNEYTYKSGKWRFIIKAVNEAAAYIKFTVALFRDKKCKRNENEFEVENIKFDV